MKNQVVIITGSSGIAAATARVAAQAGAIILLVSRNEATCRATAEEIKLAGGKCEYYLGDLVDEQTAISAVQDCVEQFGRIDALFNVAGISGRKFGDGPVHECTSMGWETTMDTNVKSTFFMCREVIKQMLQQRLSSVGLRGTILNMSSVLGYSPEPKHFATHAYAASKGAIISLSKSMAAYYAAHKIRVNVIAPALIATPMSQRAQENPAILEFMKIKQPLVGGLIEADDVAQASLFLLSDNSRHITGEVLSVDGGWRVSG